MNSGTVSIFEKPIRLEFAIQQLPEYYNWNTVIGLQNRIVHDYMNIDLQRVLGLVKKTHYRFISDFLLAPVASGMS